MYRVLLVDDEKIIREGVYELLSMTDLDLDLTIAASAVEAISVFEAQKIDIAVMDIRMPQMSGLELYDLIRIRWPMCKIIFLTGHLEFDYVYKVHKHARYVLKAEDDEKIVEAVRESIEEIENDLLLKQATLDRSKHQHLNKYYERMLLLKELVDGAASSSFLTQQALDRMWANIDIEKPIYCVMLRCAGIRRLNRQQQSEAGERMGLLIDKFYLENWYGNFYAYNKHLTYLLLQEKDGVPSANAVTFLEGCSETFQKAVEKNLGLPVSIFINRESVDIHGAIHIFAPIRDQMVTMADDEIRIGSAHEKQAEAYERMSQSIQLMEHQFENSDRLGIQSRIHQIRQEVRSVKCPENLAVMELYCTIVSKVFGFANRVGVSEDVSGRIGIPGLWNLERYNTWDDAFSHLNNVVGQLFDHLDASIECKNEDVTNTVKVYIKNHLDGDTSLHALADYVHLCPEHLLRVFKKQEGITILQYINDLKLSKAMQLLRETDIPSREIASRLGFTSAGYFGRFFKSKLGVSPNVYREQKRK